MRARPSTRAYPYIGVPAEPTTTAFKPDDVRVYLGYPAGDTISLTDDEADDLMLRSQAAFERCTGLTLFDTVFTTLRDCFSHRIELRRAPTQSVTTIKRQVSDVLTMVADTVYKLTRANQNWFGVVSLKEAQIWPTDFDLEDEVVEVIFTAGFGANETFLPDDLKAGLLRLIADLHANKGDCTDDEKLSPSSMALIRKFRIMEI